MAENVIECSRCEGEGKGYMNRVCPRCQGAGTVPLPSPEPTPPASESNLSPSQFMQSEADSIDAAEEVAEGDEREWRLRVCPECGWSSSTHVPYDLCCSTKHKPQANAKMESFLVVPKSRALAAERRIEELERRNA